MKKFIHHISQVLEPREKKKLTLLILFDFFISLLDIGFLGLLLYLVHFYTIVYPAGHFQFLLINAKDNPLLPVILFFILFSIKNLVAYQLARQQSFFFYATASRLSEKNLRRYFNGSFHDFVQTDSSIHTRRISQQPVEFAHYVLNSAHQVVSQAMLVTLTTIAILIYNPVLFILLLAILAPAVALLGWLMKRKLTRVKKTVKETGGRVLQYLNESLAGFVESNLYGRQDFFVKRYAAVQKTFNGFLSEQQILQNLPGRFMEIFAVFGLLILLSIHAYLPVAGTIDIITIGAFMAAAYKIIPGMVKILNSLGQIRSYQYTLDDLLLQLPAESPPPAGKLPLHGFAFHHVSFDHDGKNILKNFSCSAGAGQFIGIKGSSGNGKTTFLNLLLGFLEPSCGTISINGSAAVVHQRRKFWSSMAYVKQQPFLIHDTIAKNISMDENIDEQKLQAALERTGLLELVNTLPGGINHVISENGRNLSGGQRQRIALARAFYRDADLYILDEPFSELDDSSEKKLILHLRALAGSGKIVVLVSHTMESLASCNQVINIGNEG